MLAKAVRGVNNTIVELYKLNSQYRTNYLCLLCTEKFLVKRIVTVLDAVFDADFRKINLQICFS